MMRLKERREEKLPDLPQAGLYLINTLHLLKCRTGARLEVNWSTHAQKMINLARIHDKCGLKKYWEEKIESHVQKMGNEDSRKKSSALSKLREEWVQRLEFRNQHVIESMREQQIRRAQRVQGILRVSTT